MTTEDFALYMRWQRYIFDTHPELSSGIVRETLISYCFAQAVGGRNGRGCHVSNVTVAEQLEKNRDTIAKYRREAIRLGWLTPTGVFAGRVEKLDVSIPGEPAETEPEVKLAEMTESATRIADSRNHEGSPNNCPVCEPNRAKVLAGKLTVAECASIHFGTAGS